MSKEGKTKDEILQILKGKSLRLTDITERLDVNVAAVCVHLHELLESGELVREGRYYTLPSNTW